MNLLIYKLNFAAKHTARTTDPGFARLFNNATYTEKLGKPIFKEEFTIHLDDKEVNAAEFAIKEQNKSVPRHFLNKPLTKCRSTCLKCDQTGSL